MIFSKKIHKLLIELFILIHHKTHFLFKIYFKLFIICIRN